MSLLTRLYVLYKKYIQPEDYVKRVRMAEKSGFTYLPDNNGNYPKGGTRLLDQRDILGRWSLGWRPKPNYTVGTFTIQIERE